MARVFAQARDYSGEWSLVFHSGWQRQLRVGGPFAGCESKEQLKEKLKEELLKQQSTLSPSTEERDYSLRERTGEISGGTASCFPAPALEDSRGPSLNNPLIEGDVDDFVLEFNGRAISITNLPIWIEGEVSGGCIYSSNVYLIGTTREGLEPFKKRVNMWRLTLHPKSKPSFLLKTATGGWLRLLKPQEPYLRLMSDGYALAHFLHFVKKNPSASATSAERYLRKECSVYGDERPSLDNLSQHLEVIRSYMEKDPELGRASVLRKIFPNLVPKEDGSPWPSANQNGRKPGQSKSITVIQGTRQGNKHVVGKRIGPLYERDSSPPRDDDNLASEYVLVLSADMEGCMEQGSDILPQTSAEFAQKRQYKMARKQTRKLETLEAPKISCHSDHDSDYEVITTRKHPPRSTTKERKYNHDHHLMPMDVELEYQYEQVYKSRRKDPQRRSVSLADLEMEDPPICVLCDDGGDLIYCEGPCHRHFHATAGAGVDTFCQTLRLTIAEIKAMGKFYCKNCVHKQHQCFICGELGLSVPTSHGCQEVHCCDIPSCKRFYHADCAAQMLAPLGDWRDLADDIQNGRQKLYCPRHCCDSCGKAELKDPGMLVQCRRCPRGWHRECLTNFSRSGQLESTPIWMHHDRQFIYCSDHEILPDIQTPRRDHVKFPVA